MFIAILDVATDAADRDAALTQLLAEQEIVRAMPGCIDFRAFLSPTDATSVTVLHEWADEDSFAQYLASDAFARSGQVLRPLMSGPAVSRRFRAELVETVR